MCIKSRFFSPLTQRRIKMKGEIYSQNLQPSDAARSWEMNEKAVCRFRAAILVFPLRLPSVCVCARIYSSCVLLLPLNKFCSILVRPLFYITTNKIYKIPRTLSARTFSIKSHVQNFPSARAVWALNKIRGDSQANRTLMKLIERLAPQPPKLPKKSSVCACLVLLELRRLCHWNFLLIGPPK